MYECIVLARSTINILRWSNWAERISARLVMLNTNRKHNEKVEQYDSIFIAVFK